ncbi:hypothetical protein AB0395_41765 [Streptosporangium sp. NPDC051023]|uniref:hypothetical protein n=1 Tax=Streptosporangium sp. NPDC051023 TaxID=3155410 RepID=UPI00344D1D02
MLGRPQGPPVVFEHEGCGGRIHRHLGCEACAAAPAPAQVKARQGPGARAVQT